LQIDNALVSVLLATWNGHGGAAGFKVLGSRAGNAKVYRVQVFRGSNVRVYRVLERAVLGFTRFRVLERACTWAVSGLRGARMNECMPHHGLRFRVQGLEFRPIKAWIRV
jgi:hypothetical protein